MDFIELAARFHPQRTSRGSGLLQVRCLNPPPLQDVPAVTSFCQTWLSVAWAICALKPDQLDVSGWQRAVQQEAVSTLRRD